VFLEEEAWDMRVYCDLICFPFHTFLKEWAASESGAVFSDFTQGTSRDKAGFEPGLAYPRAMLTSTVAAGGGSLAAGSHVVELLAPCALGRHGPRLLWLNCYFNVTQAVQVQYFLALRNVV
jgi:hypothetical protein